MLLQLSQDQEFFRETTAKFLAELVPVGELRRLRDDPVGFDADYWRRGAELGWTSLLVAEDHGGGSISGEGVVDLSVIAHEIGRAAAPGPFVPTNVVAVAPSPTEVDLSWTAPTDNVAVVGYTVYRDGAPITTIGSREILGGRSAGAQLPGFHAVQPQLAQSGARARGNPGAFATGPKIPTRALLAQLM